MFPVGTTFSVLEGESLQSISLRLEHDGYIHSALWFRVWVSSIGRDRHVHLGGYIFNEPRTLGYIVKKVIAGTPDVPLVSLTIPEGSTSHEVALLAQQELATLSVESFEEAVAAKKANGKLFPSTYFLLPSTKEKRIIQIMMETFDTKYLEAYASSTPPSPLTSKDDVISLAAILEGEANTKEDMHIVAGILLKRLQIGMPLQVDVAPETYKMKGLPPQPINNPGMMSLSAVFDPKKTDYLFYLTGKDGTMHYAKTFTEHKANIIKYLR
jgi:UPF0755 protein